MHDGTVAPARMQDDPRWIEYRDAIDDARENGPASDQRVRAAMLPYCELMCEQCPPHTREHMMASLHFYGFPLTVIALAFRATVNELDHVRNQPVLVASPADEVRRLRSLPYGEYLKTAHWQSVRQEALKRFDHACAVCNWSERLSSTGWLEVHHRTYERLGEERPADVIVLCDRHHRMFHGKLEAA